MQYSFKCKRPSYLSTISIDCTVLDVQCNTKELPELLDSYSSSVPCITLVKGFFRAET